MSERRINGMCYHLMITGSVSKCTKRFCGVCSEKTREDARRHESCFRKNRGCFTTMQLLPEPGASPVPGREEHLRTGTTSLVTWPCSVWLFSVPQTQGYRQGNLFWRRGGHHEGRKDGDEGNPWRILPAAHRSMAEKMEKCIRLEAHSFEGKIM